MSDSPVTPNQLATYQKYLSLTAAAIPLAGAFVVCPTMDGAGAEWAIATTLAGAAFLSIDAQMPLLKFAQQHNACDFLVNSLDEAVRILKNQIRKRQPISVGLMGDAVETLQRMVERGIQPEFLIVENSAHNEALLEAKQNLTARGAKLLELLTVPAENLARWVVEDRKDFVLIDALVAAALPTDDTLRRHWLQSAPAYFFRQRPHERVLSLYDDEAASLIQELQVPAWRAHLRRPITFSWGNTSLRVEPFL